MVNMSLKTAFAVIEENDGQQPLISDHIGSRTTSTAPTIAL